MRTGTVNTENLLFCLVLFVVSLNLVLPGETWFQTRAMSQLLVFAALGALLALRAREGQASAGETAQIAGLSVLFLLLFLPSMLFSSCAGRSLEALSLWLAYFALILLVRRLRVDSRLVEQAITAVCLVAVFLLAYGLYQYVTGFGGLAGDVAADATLTQGQRADLLSRLSSGRIFSTFPLPTTFAELIVFALPLLLHRVCAARRAGRRAAIAGWGAAALLALAVLPLTGSYGSVPVLAVLGFLALLASAGRWPPGRRAAAAVSLLLCAAVAFFAVLQMRGFTPWAADQAHNPVAQRLCNWRSAVSIWNEHPLAGAGPGNFGVAYARHRLPGANETVVAHNTWLHAAAEGGVLPGAALAVLGVLLGWRAVRRLLFESAGGAGADRALCYTVMALLLYACFEITVEFPGIGYPGFFFIALASRSLFPSVDPDQSTAERATPGRALNGMVVPGATILTLILLAGFVWTCVWYRGQEQLAGAMALAAEGPVAGTGAEQAAEAASRWNPFDPEPHALRGALLLTDGVGQRNPDALRQAVDAFRAAAALDPERAFFHDRLSVAHEGLGEGLSAFLEADTAWRLYPLQARYQDRRARLLGQAGGG